MALSCPRCLRKLEFLGERPSYCAYCGVALPKSTLEEKPTSTVDYSPPELISSESPSEHTGFPNYVGGFRLIRKLGQGGMGSVHEAEEEVSGRRVAVKLIAPEFTASSHAVERFLQEGRLASSIAHPRCVFVIAADESNGWPYIVMELMPGDTLRDLVTNHGPLAQTKAVMKIMDVIEGLQEAHKLGVIHRDVKPSNCFLDVNGRVKIGDFGLSKSLMDVDVNLTRSGSFLGTPHYASPEQLKGEAIDERSDVYSVTATLYFLLTGRPPHDASDPTVALAHIVSEDAPALRSICPLIWAALEEVVIRGLQRDRKRRYKSLEELREALEPFLPGRVTIGRIGLRTAAFPLDNLLSVIVLPPVVVSLLSGLLSVDPRRYHYQADFLHGMSIFLYFALFETLGQATPGKRAFGLRVISVKRGGYADWRESIVRVVVFGLIVIMPTWLYAILSPHNTALRTEISVVLLIHLASTPLLFVTARPSNGYRGLHEIVSQTAVASLPQRFRRRARLATRKQRSVDLTLLQPAGLPTELGSFKVDGALIWTSTRRLVLGEDPQLERIVWITLDPKGSSEISPARQDVGRLARPRWLNSGDHDGWAWDAFVAPTGLPITHLVKTRGPLEWNATREILEALLSEIQSGSHDQTLPAYMAIDNVWIQPDGRIVLLDDCLNPLPIEGNGIVAPNSEARSLELLRRVAICSLSGRTVVPADTKLPVGGPIPGHAIKMMERLCKISKPFETVSELREELDKTRDMASELRTPQRLGHAIYTVVATWIKALLFPVLHAAALYITSDTLFDLTTNPLRQISLAHIFLTQTFAWILLAMLMGDGLSGLIFGITVIKSNGRKASSTRRGWREAIRWIPCLLFIFGTYLLPNSEAVNWRRALDIYFVGIVGLLPILYVVHGWIYPGRYLNDRLARTAIVPR
jgi:uncharacterized RDD family membrane protein YckC